jgi:tight adherence protein C
MNPAIVLGVGVGVGIVGVVVGLTPRKRRLYAILRTMEGESTVNEPVSWGRAGGAQPDKGARDATRRWLGNRALILLDRYPNVARLLEQDIQATSTTLEELAERVAFACVTGSIAPVVLWLLLSLLGTPITPVIPVSLALFAGPCSTLLPILALRGNANRARRLARKMVGCYLDLVVLGLAGGLGVEGALHSAALTCEMPLSQRLVRAMDEARDAGGTPWAALAGLGRLRVGGTRSCRRPSRYRGSTDQVDTGRQGVVDSESRACRRGDRGEHRQ